MKTGKQRDSAALAETAQDNAIVWNASSDFAGNNVVNKRFAVRKAVRIEIALVFKVFVEGLDVEPGAKGCEAGRLLAGNKDFNDGAPYHPGMRAPPLTVMGREGALGKMSLAKGMFHSACDQPWPESPSP